MNKTLLSCHFLIYNLIVFSVFRNDFCKVKSEIKKFNDNLYQYQTQFTDFAINYFQ